MSKSIETSYYSGMMWVVSVGVKGLLKRCELSKTHLLSLFWLL